MIGSRGSNLYNGKTLTDIIDQQKAEDRVLYQRRQELKRQQEEREAAARKAAEKAPLERILEKKETVKHLVNSMQAGSPRNEECIITALKQICDILDFCLNDCKPELNPGDKQPEE